MPGASGLMLDSFLKGIVLPKMLLLFFLIVIYLVTYSKSMAFSYSWWYLFFYDQCMQNAGR